VAEHEVKAVEIELGPQPGKTIVTDRALAQIRALQPEGSTLSNLRLIVQGGGCAGLTYKVVFNPDHLRRDRVLQFDGLRFLVDPKSLIYLHDMTLDFMDEATQKGFIVVNPNASKGCGCGTSVEE
jgi:iron-sulfur cluster assembly protein